MKAEQLFIPLFLCLKEWLASPTLAKNLRDLNDFPGLRRVQYMS